MHKKPVYSFEDKNSKGVSEVPIYSIMSIERPDASSLLGTSEPVLIIVLAKAGDISTVNKFIATETNWMWFYNGDLQDQLKLYVKKVGDTMTGDLKMINTAGLKVNGTGSISTSSGDITSGGSIIAADDSFFSKNVSIGKHLWFQNQSSSTVDGSLKLVGSVMHADHIGGLTIEINNRRVLTEVTGVEFHDYAAPTLGGIIKAKRVGNVLYMTTNGTNAGP